MDKLRIVKGIVFIMTFFLIAGTLVLIGVIYKKSHPATSMPTELSLFQPEGSNIAEIRTDNGLLFILTKGGGIADRIIVYNPNARQIAYTINVNENGNNKDGSSKR